MNGKKFSQISKMKVLRKLRISSSNMNNRWSSSIKNLIVQSKLSSKFYLLKYIFIRIKPSAKLKDMQNNEKLVAINERIEEAMNYRKELKDLEVQEAERVEKLR